MKTLCLALVVAAYMAPSAVGREPQIGDSVIVVSDRAEVKSKEGSLGIVPRGSQFSVKQKSGPWLLGLFQIEGRRVFGWMHPSSVHVLEPDITQLPAHEFTWHNLLLARDKVDDHFTLADHVDDYMKSVRSNVWEQNRNDEFQLQKRRIETLAIVNKRVAEFDIERDFILKTHLTFDSYDFEKGMFPIKEATDSHYWYEYNSGYSDDLPNQLEVYLKDPKMISGIPMEATAAERFVAVRKSSYGSVNRRVYANIRLRITGIRSSGGLEAEVRWAQFFGNKNRTQLVFETPRSPVEFDADAEEAMPAESGAQATVAKQPSKPKVNPARVERVGAATQPSTAKPVLPSAHAPDVPTVKATSLPTAYPIAQSTAPPATHSTAFPIVHSTVFPSARTTAQPFTQQPFQQGQS